MACQIRPDESPPTRGRKSPVRPEVFIIGIVIIDDRYPETRPFSHLRLYLKVRSLTGRAKKCQAVFIFSSYQPVSFFSICQIYRTFQVSLDVFKTFTADGQADQVIGYPSLFSLLFGYTGMSHACRMLDKAPPLPGKRPACRARPR